MRKTTLGESGGPLRSGKRYCRCEQKNAITRLTAGVIGIGMDAKGSEFPLLIRCQGLAPARSDLGCCGAGDSDSDIEVVGLLEDLIGAGSEDDVEEDKDLAGKGRDSTAEVNGGEARDLTGLSSELRDRRPRPRRRWAKRET